MAADSFTLSPSHLLKSIYDFLYFWYIRGSKDFLRGEMNAIKGVERDIGILINLKLVFQPIYGDYSILGKLIGPILRLGRVFLGFMLVVFLSIIIVALYLLWLLLPPVAFIMFLKNIVYILAR